MSLAVRSAEKPSRTTGIPVFDGCHSSLANDVMTRSYKSKKEKSCELTDGKTCKDRMSSTCVSSFIDKKK